MNTHWIRRENGKVTQKGTGATPEWLAEMEEKYPGEYFLDNGNTEIAPLKLLKLPEPKHDPTMVTVEELTDAVIKLAAGDKSAIDGIALRRKRKIKKAEEDGADPGRAAKRSAGRHKAASE